MTDANRDAIGGTATPDKRERLAEANAEADRKAKYFLAAIVESSQDAIVTVDFEGTITSWNQAAEQLYGYSTHEAIGQSLMALVLPQNLQEMLSNIDRVKHSQKVEVFDSVRVHKNGRELLLEAVMSPVKDEGGKVIGASCTARDVTARRHIEEQLRESELKFRTLSDTAPALIWFDDPQGNCLYVNQRYLEFAGKTMEEIQGTGWHLILHEEDAPAYLADFQAATRERRPFHHVVRAQRFDGQWRWIESFAQPLFAANDTFLGHVGISPDITDRRRAEEALRKSEERVRTVVESVQDFAIITYTDDNHIASWNPGATNLFGYEAEEVVGQPGDILFTPEDRARGEVQKELETARREGRAADERWHMRKDGTRFYASGVMTQLQSRGDGVTENGIENGFVKIARDLTLQKQAQDALAASEASFRTLANALPQLVWTNDAEGDANYFNQRVCRLTHRRFQIS